jgi:O-succinylbenzoic acid--CoA ligase
MNDIIINMQDIQKKHSQKPALIWPDGELSYLQYFRAINNMSETLSEKGVNPREICAVITDINHQFPIIFFAIIKLGGIVLPLNPKSPHNKINEILNKFECDSLISIDSSFTPESGSQTQVICDVFDIENSTDGKDPENNFTFDFEQDVTIILTSGSEGKQKGVLHKLENHFYSALGSNENIPLKPEDCWMVSLPFFHIAGIAILFRTLLTGAACYIPDRNKKTQEQLGHMKVTHLSLVPTQVYRWLQDMESLDIGSSLKTVLVGGSHIPEGLIKSAVQKNLPVYTSYGSTEMSSQITTTRIEDLKLNPKSSGRLLSHRELKIDNSGEVLVRGKTLASGYISHKKNVPFTDDEGWFHTGDLGYVDDNQNLVVTGRRDNMFISGGENIYPEEIEQYLQFHDRIIDVCVVDIPDDEFGARPIAFIKMEGKVRINEIDLKVYLKDKIAGFKIPIRFLPWPEEMGSLKPDRKYFRELAIKILSSL